MTGREQRIREFPECVYTVKVFTFCSSYQTLSHAQVLAVKKTRFCKCTVEVYITGTRVSALSLSPSSLIIHKHFSFSSIPDALKHDLSLLLPHVPTPHIHARARGKEHVGKFMLTCASWRSARWREVGSTCTRLG